MDRVHRIGQSRPVRVIRFIMKDSIETRSELVTDVPTCSNMLLIVSDGFAGVEELPWKG